MLIDVPQVTIQISQDVADALGRQARALQLGRRQYVRSLLAAAAARAEQVPATAIAPAHTRPQEHVALAMHHRNDCSCWHYTASLPPAAIEALDRQAAELFLSRSSYVDGLLQAIAQAGEPVAA